ncbi:ATP:cob(I)alamin adenosyltransferase [Sulfodiicoccus acidiphilus]|uniref:ATP:cob(I)alamin adenosyltransferase n=1 Tax=Sulfodiicoccus acidiphilus TaxID=1670455 RepID=A0A348B737_9CREN|nr:cob(I)yrinic acid a,c-diamide adenosyltransferase [Sulfodiicoccus acidiphilus]BBD73989.1 ATP:cob(I)alamin adenosyltransferase [Sulfodiicoccus acidiphilus]GGU02628.1 ATP:cob(I)alamin adenosyltransferase [Sulfodiicoccus acidiphilus]
MFTRSGDDGTTSVKDKRIGKDSPVVEFLGEVDELNSFLGFALSSLTWEDMRRDIERVQFELFQLGQDVATEGERASFSEENVKWIEERTIYYRKESGPVRLFVIPGGTEQAVRLHLVRTIARRVERKLVRLSREVSVNRWTIVYLNRLSSMLFSMAVVANKRSNSQERYFDINRYF